MPGVDLTLDASTETFCDHSGVTICTTPDGKYKEIKLSNSGRVPEDVNSRVGSVFCLRIMGDEETTYDAINGLSRDALSELRFLIIDIRLSELPPVLNEIRWLLAVIVDQSVARPLFKDEKKFEASLSEDSKRYPNHCTMQQEEKEFATMFKNSVVVDGLIRRMVQVIVLTEPGPSFPPKNVAGDRIKLAQVVECMSRARGKRPEAHRINDPVLVNYLAGGASDEAK
jgi:hypothetical protein